MSPIMFRSKSMRFGYVYKDTQRHSYITLRPAVVSGVRRVEFLAELTSKHFTKSPMPSPSKNFSQFLGVSSATNTSVLWNQQQQTPFASIFCRFLSSLHDSAPRG